MVRVRGMGSNRILSGVFASESSSDIPDTISLIYRTSDIPDE